MIVRQYAPCSLGRSIICLGKQGEINALRVEFDVSAWMAMYPDATVKLMHFAPDRPQDNPVIPTLGVEGTLRVWIVGEEDTAGAGNGVIELLLIDERTGSTIKSATGYTTVLRSPSAGIEAQEAEAGYVRYDVDQSALLTDEQKAVARKNIGAGTGDGTGSGGILKETDPTVPDWAKQPSKPTYTAGEVGALPSSYTPPVTSVNGKTGEVALSAQDVRARPDTWTPSASDVGADAAGTASGAVAAHNTSGAAHADLRALIEGLTSRLNALADSDDTTLDQLSEIVAYIKSNKTLIDAVTTGKVSTSDIVDNLTTNSAGKVLSAAQGVALKAMIDGIVIPTALPNPQPITINGQRYDGSEAVTVTVSSEGGGTPVEIDDTLTQSGKAADAKAVGDRLSALNTAKVSLPKDNTGAIQNGTNGQILQTNGDGTTQWVDKPTGGNSENIEKAQDNLTELNNPITDIIGTIVANEYTRKWTHKCVSDTANVHNGGMLCNDPPAYGVMVGETKFNSSSDAQDGKVYVRWVSINSTFGKNGFTFSSDSDVQILAKGSEITRINGTVEAVTGGAFGDQILHDTANNKYIVIAETINSGEKVICARVTTVTSNGAKPTMEFSAAQEMVLVVDGENYNIPDGLQKINSDFDNISQYNGDIAYVGGLFYWVLTNNYKGWVILTSSDGLSWEFNRYIVPDKGAENLFIEAAIGYHANNKTMLIAGRTKSETGYMVLTAYNVSSGRQCTKLIPDTRIGSKPSIAMRGSCYYVGHNVGNRSDYELLLVNTYHQGITAPLYQTMDIWRVNAWHGVATQYATIRIGAGASHYGYTNIFGETTYANPLHCYGMDGNQFLKKGASFIYDALDVSLLALNNGNNANLENGYYNKGLQLAGIVVDSELSTDSTNAIQNAAVTAALAEKADVSDVVKTVNGTKPDASGNVVVSASGSDTWELIEKYTITDGDTSHKTVLSKAYKRFLIFMDSVYASGSTNLQVMADTDALVYNARMLARVSLTNSMYKYTYIEIDKIAANRIVTKQSNQASNISLGAAYYWNVMPERMAENYLRFVVATDGVTLTGGTIEIYGIPG